MATPPARPRSPSGPRHGLGFELFAAVVLVLQAGAILLAAWFIAYDQAAGGFSSVEGLALFPLLLLVFPSLAVVGFLPALFFLRKSTIPAAVLLVASVLMGTLVVPAAIASGLSSFLSPVARWRLAESRNRIGPELAETVNTHYSVLSEAFQQPQKIMAVDGQYVLLQDGNILQLLGLQLTRYNEADFADYAEAHLVGRTLKIDLPDHWGFAEHYSPGARTGIFADKGLGWPRDPKRNVPYGVIPALIHVDGALVNSRFSGGSTCAEISATCDDAFSGYASGRSARSFSARGRARSDRLVEAASVRARWPGGPRVFASPDEAARALIDTVKANDVKPLVALFGSPGRADGLVDTGDEADRNRGVFVAAAADAWRWEDVGPSRKELVLGSEAWPFPVPLVKGTAGWSFDPEAGREEVLNRQIGRNELAVIRVLHDYVAAQNAYATTGHDGKPAGPYARHLGSERGKQDGLYWPPRRGERRSPLDFPVAQAESGDGRHEGPSPFHGYHFRVLEGQGSAAKGGAARYVVNGEMTGGFALVAWPYMHPAGQRNVLSGSGVMTFIVNQDDVVYEKDLGPQTSSAVKEITLFDPDGTWRPVQTDEPLTTLASRRP